MKLHPLALAFAVSVVVACTGCGPLKYELVGSPSATGADAKLTADIKEDQQLTAIEFTAQNLAPPDRIKEGLTVFIVWQRKSDQSAWSRVGALNYDAEARSGTMAATVPQVAFDLEVTAESDSEAQSPGAVVVFSRRVP